MTDGYLQPGTGGAFPPGMPTFNKLSSTLSLYIDPVNGSDDNPGTQSDRSIQTAAKLADLIALSPGNVDVHMRSGIVTLPDRGWFLRQRIFGGLVRFIADETWDPTVFTVIGGNRTAAAGTTLAVVKAAGLVVNALQDLTIRFTSGAAAGQYRRVRNNTSTDIVPVEAFAPAPVDGDTYQIITSNAEFALPTAAPYAEWYTFCGDSPVMPNDPLWTFPADITTKLKSGLLFDGVNLRGSANYTGYQFGRTDVYFFGTDAITDFANAIFAGQFNFQGTRVTSALANGEYDRKQGWGLRCVLIGGQGSDVQYVGYLNAERIGSWIWDGPATYFLYGGHVGFVWLGTLFGNGATISPNKAQCALMINGAYDTVHFLVDGGGTPAPGAPGVSVFGNNVLTLLSVDLPAALAVTLAVGGKLYLSTHTSGGTPINISGGAALWGIDNGISIGGAGNDWNVTGIAAFNKSFFAAAGLFKLGTDGSLAYRQS